MEPISFNEARTLLSNGEAIQDVSTKVIWRMDPPLPNVIRTFSYVIDMLIEWPRSSKRPEMDRDGKFVVWQGYGYAQSSEVS